MKVVKTLDSVNLCFWSNRSCRSISVSDPLYPGGFTLAQQAMWRTPCTAQGCHSSQALQKQNSTLSYSLLVFSPVSFVSP